LAETTFKEAFQKQLGGVKLNISGRLYPAEIIVRLSIGNKINLKKHNFSVSVDHIQENFNALEQMHLGIDILASFLEDFLQAEDEKEEIDLPLDWHDYDVEGQKIYLIYDTVNDDLEAEANALLGISEDTELVDEDELGADFLSQKPDPDEMH
jgi:hypothetical protein